MDLVPRVARLGARTQGLVTRAGLAAGGVSDGALSRAVSDGALVRVRRRVYAITPLGPLPRHVVVGSGVAPAYVQHVRAALMSLGPRVFATDRTAAALYGWGMLVEPARTVELGAKHGWGKTGSREVRARQRRAALVQRWTVLPGTAPLRITSPAQTVLDCALALPLVEAVVVCDSALRAGDVSVEELQGAVDRVAGRAEAARIRRVLDLCDPECGSVLESVLRVRMSLAGIDGWATQVVLRRAPELRVDFCFAGVRLVVEVDGAKWHQDPVRDQARDNALAALGWRVLRYRWAEVVHDTGRVLAEIRAACAAALPAAA
jgi:very-short-patch-repair endonuclease